MQNETNKTGMVAVHSLSIENMEKVLDRNSFICPSIAYTTEENCLCNYNYGEISVVFSEDTINPLKNPNSLLLSGDGYTSTIPRTFNTDNISDDELVKLVKDSYFDNKSFMYTANFGSCKAAAAVPIYLDQAIEEKNRILSFDEYREYKDKLWDEYEAFLDKNFKGWDSSATDQKHVFRSPFMIENGIAPCVELGLKEAIKAHHPNHTPNQNYKAIKEACQKYGLKVTKPKINKIIAFAQKLRESSICYFEAKIFEAVPVNEIKGMVIPEHYFRLYKELENKLKNMNIPYSVYTYPEERKNQIILFAHSNQERNITDLSSLEDKLEAAEQKAALHNKGIENKTKDELEM